jgi:hypothetical protein
MCNNSLHGR